MAAWKQSDGLIAETIGTGDSPLRPNIAISRSACSVLVGMPVDGPARCTSTMISGSSVETARPTGSILRMMPGPELGVPERPAKRRPQLRADRADLVLGVERPHPELLVLRQLMQDVGGRGERVRAE